MKSRILACISAAVALAALSLPTAASAAASQRESYQKTLNKRVADEKLRHGICVCRGGDLDMRAGLITYLVNSNANEVEFLAACVAQSFDGQTGAYSTAAVCDETWVSLPE